MYVLYACIYLYLCGTGVRPISICSEFFFNYYVTTTRSVVN